MEKRVPVKIDSGNCSRAEEKFCLLLVLTGDQRNSAGAAWPSAKTGKQKDNRAIIALKRPRVQAFIKSLREEIVGSKDDIKKEIKRTMEEIRAIAFASPIDAAKAIGLPENVIENLKDMGASARAISEIDIEQVGIPVFNLLYG